MDPRERADATLARARARSGSVVTPDNAMSPMDSASTMQIPRAVVDEADVREDPDPTVILRDGEDATQPHPWRDETRTVSHAHPLATGSTVRNGNEMPQQSGPSSQEQDGLIPTVTRSEGMRPNVAQRLDGNGSNVTRRLNG